MERQSFRATAGSGGNPQRFERQALDKRLAKRAVGAAAGGGYPATSLTDTAIRKARPGLAPIKLRDDGGLYLLLRPDGARWWRGDYRRPVAGQRNILSLGTAVIPPLLASSRSGAMRPSPAS